MPPLISPCVTPILTQTNLKVRFGFNQAIIQEWSPQLQLIQSFSRPTRSVMFYHVFQHLL